MTIESTPQDWNGTTVRARGLAGDDGSFIDALGNPENVSGFLLTQALIYQGFARDAEALQAVYQEHQDAIAAYLAQVDKVALVRYMRESSSSTTTATAALAGLTVGGIITYLLTR